MNKNEKVSQTLISSEFRKKPMSEVFNLILKKVLIIRSIFRLENIDYPSTILLTLIGNIYHMLGEGIINRYQGFAFVLSVSKEHRVGLAVTQNIDLQSMGNQKLRNLIECKGYDVPEFEVPDDESLSAFLEKLIEYGILQLSEKYFEKSSTPSDLKNLARRFYYDSNGTPTPKEFKHMWKNLNYQVRTAYLWEALLSTCNTERYEETDIVYEPYNYLREILRLNLSPRALELLKSGKLDIAFPEDFPKDENGDPKLGQLSIEELADIVDNIKPATEWKNKVHEILDNKTEEINQQIHVLRDTYRTLPTPRTLRLIPVMYGTIGSFDSTPTSALIANTHGLNFDPSSGQLNSSFDSFLEWAKSPPDEKMHFGSLFPYVYSQQNTDIDAHPFSIYIRFPENIDELDLFAEEKLISITAEEYLHLCLFHWSTYYGWPHAIEEFIVNELLKLNNLSHSGTPAVLNESDEIAIKDGVNQFHNRQITFNQFLIIVNKVVHPGYKTKTEMNDESKANDLVKAFEHLGGNPQQFDIKKYREWSTKRTQYILNKLKKDANDIITKYRISSNITNLDLVLLTSLFEFTVPNSSPFPFEATSVLRPNGLTPMLMSMHKLFSCLGNGELEAIYLNKKSDDIKQIISELNLVEMLENIVQVTDLRYLSISQDFIVKMLKHFSQLSGRDLWLVLNKELRKCLFLSALILNIDVNNNSPTLILADYEGFILEQQRLTLNHRSAQMVKDGTLDFKAPDSLSAEDIVSKDKLKLENNLREKREKYLTTSKIILEKLNGKLASIQNHIDTLSKKLPSSFPLATRKIAIRIAFNGTIASFTSPLGSLQRGITFDPIYNQEEEILESTVSGFENFLKIPFDEREYYGKVFPFYLEHSFLHHQPLSVVIRFPENENEIDDFIHTKLEALLFEEILHISLYHFSTFYGWPHAVEKLIVYKILKSVDHSHSETPINLDADLKLNIEPEIDRFLSQELAFSELAQIITQIIHSK